MKLKLSLQKEPKHILSQVLYDIICTTNLLYGNTGCLCGSWSYNIMSVVCSAVNDVMCLDFPHMLNWSAALGGPVPLSSTLLGT